MTDFSRSFTRGSGRHQSVAAVPPVAPLPALEGAAVDAQLRQRPTEGDLRLLGHADHLRFFDLVEPHVSASSEVKPIMSFFSPRFLSIDSAASRLSRSFSRSSPATLTSSRSPPAQCGSS